MNRYSKRLKTIRDSLIVLMEDLTQSRKRGLLFRANFSIMKNKINYKVTILNR